MQADNRINDFEVQALVYLGPRSKRGIDRFYNASVRITHLQSDASQVFRVPLVVPMEYMGDARRAAEAYGAAIIKGEVADVSIAGLAQARS